MILKYRNQKNAESIAAYWKKPLDKPDWYSINDLAGDTPEIYIYDVIGYPYMDVGELLRTMATIKDKPILARINTPGGDVWDGMALLNGFLNHPAGVTVRIESLAASMGAVLAMGGRKVEAYSNAMMMIHNSWVVAAGNRTELLATADILEQVDENLMNEFVRKTKIGKKEMRDMLSAETWMNAKTMKEKGFIDTIIEAGKGAKAAFDLSIFSNLPNEFKEQIGNKEQKFTERDLERGIRDVFGLSESKAKAVITGCKKVAGDNEEAEAEAAKQAEINECKAAMENLISTLKRK